MFVLSKNETKRKNISAGLVHFQRTEIDSKDFKNEILSATMRRNEGRKTKFFLKKHSKKS